jgi:hypothetical protein
MQDNDKPVLEQIVDQVNDFVENLANSASDALDSAEPVVIDKQSGPAPRVPAQDAIEPQAPLQLKEQKPTGPVENGPF